MKKFSIFLFAFVIGLMGTAYGQTITVGANPTNLPCGGGNVDFSAVGNSTTPVFGDNFNSGGVAPGWAASAAAQFNNPCGPSLDGSTYLWMGPGTSAPRNMTTAPVDVSCGGTVCFDFKFTCELCGDSSPCEGADLYNEGVSLQCSTDGGATWTDFAYFAPNGDILTAYPGGVTQPSASGNTPFTTWQNYCFTIPAGCETNNTMFQLHQWGSSGSGWDHWGIDNFYVYANPCAPYYCDWDHIPGAPDACDVTSFVSQSGWYDVCYTNGTNSVCDSVFITVDGMNLIGVNTTTEACLGDNTGTATINISGGTAPYTYNIAGPTPGSNGTGNFTNLAPGNYTFTVTDNGGCQITGNFVIDPGPACCTVTATGTDLLCNNDGSGTTTANPANGVGPYTYQWGPGTGNQTTQTASNLPAGTYNVTITDALGCTASTSVTINEPTALNATQTPTDPSCFGVCDGSIVVNAPTGGTPGYTYNINGGTFGGSGTFNGLCDGTYNIIVEDANGCQFNLSNIVLTEPTDVTLAEVSNSPATCGVNNGSLEVVAGGGTPGYQYDIGGAQQGSPIFNGLASGTYTVTVTDANGCTETVNVNVGSSAGPVPFVDVIDPVTCAGALTGSVTIGVTGNGPFQFSIDGGTNWQGSNVFNNVPSGAFCVDVEDANGCTGQICDVVPTPSALTFNTSVQDANCNGVCDGEITVNASNATPPYTYSDDNGMTFQASNVLTGLCAGNIDVVVQDANGCLANATVVVNEPTPLTLNPSFVEPSCNGLCDGSITFAAGGGTPGYQYSVDDGNTFTGTDPVTGICAGFYDIVVADANGCQLADTLTVTEPPPFTFNYIANNPSNCGANDGSFEITAIGSMGPYLYSIDGMATFQVNNGFFGSLYSGLYELVVQDGNGCIDSTIEALSDNIMTTQTDVTQDATCYGACDGLGIVSQMFGAPPFTYTLNFNTFSQPNGVFAGLCAGDHYVTIEDAGLCLGIEQFTINEPDSILFDLAADSVSCPGGADGQITVTNVTGGDGGPNYEYSIDGVNFQASNVLTGLAPGNYTVYVRDLTNGCLGTDDIDVYEPAPWDVYINHTDVACNGDATGFVQIIGDGATPGYSYNLGGTPSLTGIYLNLTANTYNITVTDANACTFDTSVVITEPTALAANYNPTDPQCFGAADGEIEVTVTPGAGTAPYVYSSDGGTIFQSNNILTGLADGCYDVVVEDDNGCQLLQNICLTEPTEVTMNLAMTPETCGNANGTITVTPAGGTGPAYLYSNDGGTTFQGGNTFNGLAAGNYNIQVLDQNGCPADSIFAVTADQMPQIDNVVFTDPLCNGSADGSIVITASGGVGALTYSIDNGTTTQPGGTFNGLTANTYDIVVTDGNGCQATQQTVLTDPPAVSIDLVTPTALMCAGDFSGALDIQASGGTPVLQYSIDNGTTFQGGGTFSFIAAGNYDIVVEDANGCQATDIGVVTEPAPLSWTIDTATVCANVCDGTVTANVAGGTLPYDYNWGGNIAGNGQNQATLVCDGTYGLILTDANGCQLDTNNIIVQSPPPLVIPNVIPTDVSCYQGISDMSNPGVVNFDGTINIGTPTNGTGPYTFEIAPDPTGAGPQVGNGLFTNLPDGNYDITVTDANGCTAISNTTLSYPDSLYTIVPTGWTACYAEDVQVQGFNNGGSVPYTFDWDNDGTGDFDDPLFFSYNVTSQTTFTLQVQDDNGCLGAPESYTITPSPEMQIWPIPDSVWICRGENVDISVGVTGGQLIDFNTVLDYSYTWSPAGANDTLQTLNVAPTVATDYTITVEDLCGQIEDTTIHVGINPDPYVNPFGPFEGCAPDTLAFDISADIPAGYTITWDLGNGAVVTNSNPTNVIYPDPGTYDFDITVVSDSGCVYNVNMPGMVTIYEPPVPGFYFDPHSPSVLEPSVQIIDISENAVQYTYTFEGFGTSSEAEPYVTFPVEEETTIIVCQQIVSAEGCPAEICIPLDIHEEILFYVPNVVTPDGDLFNEEFFPVFTSGVDPYEYHLTIFNRWGEIVFESYDYNYGWNCHYGDGGLVQDGVYIWQIEFGEKLSDKKQTHRGHVTVLK